MRKATVNELRQELNAQGVEPLDFAFVCPMCQTVQSARDLIRAGAGATFGDVEKYLGFSCIGRFTGAPTPRQKPDGQPCDWTLGGLFSLHKLEIIDSEGIVHPYFELASPDQAKENAQKFQGKEGGAA